MKFTIASSRMRYARGFSLVELLIGVVIGLVGLLAIFQVVTVWDSHNRTTTAGSDADVGGTLAMFSLERDIKQAGLGMRPTAGWQYTCNNTNIEVDDTVGAAGALRFHPVEIITGAAGAPDAINVFYGDTSFMPAPEAFSLSTPTTKTITPNRYGFKPGDLAIVTGSSSSQPCALVEITAGADSGGMVTHAPGNYAPFYPTASASSVAARFNGSAGTTATYTSGTLFNLGPVPQFNAWSINAGVLRRTELIFNSTSPVDVSEGVVNMKAQYGIDGLTGAADQIIGTDEWTANAPAAGTWNNVLAIRVAILVRSKQWERSATGSASGVPTGVTLTAPQPSWATCAAPETCGGFAMTNVDGTTDTFGPNNADPNNWRYYRYRVYEKVIPLRNMIWGSQ